MADKGSSSEVAVEAEVAGGGVRTRWASVVAAAQVDSGRLIGEEGTNERRCEREKERAEETGCLRNALVERAERRSMSIWASVLFFSVFVTMNFSKCARIR